MSKVNLPVIKRAIFRHSLWLSLFLHFLLLFSFVVVLHLSPAVTSEPKPAMYIPSYAMNLPAPPTPVMQPQPQPQKAVSQPQPPVPKQKQFAELKPQTDKSVIPVKKQAAPSQQNKAAAAPKPASKFQSLDNTKAMSEEEPVHVIGEKKSDDPLIKLLGRAISARLVYPRAAVDFNLKGTAYIGFTLHPNGELTGIRVMQSSGADILDEAALRGIQAISPLGGANQYVPKERFLVVGIIFR